MTASAWSPSFPARWSGSTGCRPFRGRQCQRLPHDRKQHRGEARLFIQHRPGVRDRGHRRRRQCGVEVVPRPGVHTGLPRRDPGSGTSRRFGGAVALAYDDGGALAQGYYTVKVYLTNINPRGVAPPASAAPIEIRWRSDFGDGRDNLKTQISSNTPRQPAYRLATDMEFRLSAEWGCRTDESAPRTTSLPNADKGATKESGRLCEVRCGRPRPAALQPAVRRQWQRAIRRLPQPRRWAADLERRRRQSDSGIRVVIVIKR